MGEDNSAMYYENLYDRSGFSFPCLIFAVCEYAACDRIPVHDRWPARCARCSLAVCIAPFCFGIATPDRYKNRDGQRALPFSDTARDSQGRWDGSPDRLYDASGRNGIHAGTPGRECEIDLQ